MVLGVRSLSTETRPLLRVGCGAGRRATGAVGKSFDGFGGMGQSARGQVPKWGEPGVWQRLCLRCVPFPPWRGGRDRACLQEGARHFVGVPLEGPREAESLHCGGDWEVAPGSAPGAVLVDWPGMEVPGDVLRVVCGGAFWRQVPHDG